MAERKPRVALVTGCSSGIGHASALRLHKAGLIVYATARKTAKIADLASAGLRTLALDVTDETSMTSAVDRVLDERGRVDVLVNNAGYKLIGPVEETPPEEARRQFETNMFGLARMTQLVLPGMRERRYGRIVNLSSVYARFAVPGGAYPAATKHAVAGFSEALRLEVAPFGVYVIQIEPAATRSKLEENAVVVGGAAGSPYAEFNRDVARWHAQAVSGPPYNLAGRFAPTPDDVGRVIARAATSRRPRPRYPVGALAHLVFASRRLTPDRAWDPLVRTVWPVPKA